MATVECDDLASVKAAVSGFGATELFRGQVRHYADPSGDPILLTSFGREGCVPPLMRKWTYYAHETLSVAAGSRQPFDLVKTQALLQHYGWRSFFLDVSEGVGVAAWFASHRYKASPVLEMAEDCHEDPVLLFQQLAAYEPTDDSEVGHIYVFDRRTLENLGVASTDLQGIQVSPESRPRFAEQRAWLLGPIQERLPAASIAAHIVAPSGVLRTLALEAGHQGVGDLFPPRTEDPILKVLLSVPWVATGNGRIPAFGRGLPLPEYDYEVRKHRPAQEAFVHPFWFAEDRAQLPAGVLTHVPVYRTSEMAFYQVEPEARPVAQVLHLLREHPVIVVETDGLVRHPEFIKAFEYAKGVVVEAIGNDALAVSELNVDHPGKAVAGVSVSRGWHYSVGAEGRLERIAHPEDCPCNNPFRHDRHLALVYWLDACLSEGHVTQVADLVFDLQM